MPEDTYSSFADLAANAAEGRDYAIRLHLPDADVAVIAPHGGMIEPMTGEIATAVAGTDHRLYCFMAKTAGLHVTSTNFDDPRCIDAIAPCARVVAIHGLGERTRKILIGGRDSALRDRLQSMLFDAGFEADVITAGALSGTAERNICNRGRSGRGAQIEIARTLRDQLRDDAACFARFVATVRGALA